MQIKMVGRLTLAVLAGHALLAAHGAVLRSAHRKASNEASSGQVAATAAAEEAADLRFWSETFEAQQAQLKHLREAAASAAEPAPAGKSSEKDGEAADAPEVALPRNHAELLPALAMLRGLYDDGKDKIAKLNEREEDSKQKFQERQAEHTARLAEIEGRFKNRTLSEEFRVNETRDENRLWSYWEGVRKRQHQQYRTSLMIQHSTMKKVKKLIDLYEKTLSGKLTDKDEVARALDGVAPPQLVLLQQAQSDTLDFCKRAEAELEAAKRALLKQPRLSAVAGHA